MRQGALHTFKRYLTGFTHRVSAMPILILMPHAACNCRCVMCDIWKGNKNARQLEPADLQSLLPSLRKLDTRRVVMSGGEALLNRNFFSFCEILKKEGISVTLLSTGLTLERHAQQITGLVEEVIVSLDGDEDLHDEIRNIKGAFAALRDGVAAIRKINPLYRISARCVIHRLNFRKWKDIIRAAKTLGLNSISFLPADVSSTAFNRPETWTSDRQQDILIPAMDLHELDEQIEQITTVFAHEISNGFIVEPPAKLKRIAQYYKAQHGLADFPHKVCNAPWVSAVIEADGSVRPCFFHDVIGSIKNTPLDQIINAKEVVSYRARLDVNRNPTCQRCVCSLNLSPRNTHY